MLISWFRSCPPRTRCPCSESISPFGRTTGSESHYRRWRYRDCSGQRKHSTWTGPGGVASPATMGRNRFRCSCWHVAPYKRLELVKVSTADTVSCFPDRFEDGRFYAFERIERIDAAVMVPRAIAKYLDPFHPFFWKFASGFQRSRPHGVEPFLRASPRDRSGRRYDSGWRRRDSRTRSGRGRVCWRSDSPRPRCPFLLDERDTRDA